MSTDNLGILLDNASRISMPPNNGIEVFYEKNKKKMVTSIWDKLTKNLIAVKPVSHDSNVKTSRHKLKATLSSMMAMGNFKSVFNLDAIEELTDVSSSEIAMELNHSISKKIRREAATKGVWDFQESLGETINEKYEYFYVEMMKIDKIIHAKTWAKTNFILTSPEVASLIKHTAAFKNNEDYQFSSSLMTRTTGIINKRWSLIEDPLFPPTQMVIGVKDFGGNEGLIFSPRNLFEITGQSMKEYHEGDYELAADYSLEFAPNGENYYAIINIKNFPM